VITGTGYLRAGQIAHQLGVSERTVRRWIATKVLPSAKVGGARLVARANVERLLSPDWNPDEDFDLEDE
jgi:excisionase family DNA binding protein